MSGRPDILREKDVLKISKWVMFSAALGLISLKATVEQTNAALNKKGLEIRGKPFDHDPVTNEDKYRVAEIGNPTITLGVAYPDGNPSTPPKALDDNLKSLLD